MLVTSRVKKSENFLQSSPAHNHVDHPPPRRDLRTASQFKNTSSWNTIQYLHAAKEISSLRETIFISQVVVPQWGRVGVFQAWSIVLVPSRYFYGFVRYTHGRHDIHILLRIFFIIPIFCSVYGKKMFVYYNNGCKSGCIEVRNLRLGASFPCATTRRISFEPRRLKAVWRCEVVGPKGQVPERSQIPSTSAQSLARNWHGPICCCRGQFFTWFHAPFHFLLSLSTSTWVG